MSTTSLIAEMIIIGVFASIWIFLLIFKFFSLGEIDFLELFNKVKGWETSLTVLYLICCYQIGWLLNFLCFWVGDFLHFKAYKSNLAEDPLVKNRFKDIEDKKRYRALNITVYQRATPQLTTEIYMDRSVMRLSRTGVLNFGLIAVSILFVNRFSPYLAVIPFCIAIACFFQCKQRSERYYDAILYAFRATESEEPN